jgi:hypothetical protein
MTLEINPNHVAEALATLIAQFKGKTNLEGLLSLYTEEVQEIEDVLFQVLEDTVLDAAVGQQLDNLGTAVGVERGGRTDDDYRTRLRAQIAINKASGTLPEIVEILRLVTANVFEVVEWYPAGLTVRIDDALTESPTELAGILREARAAAVQTYLTYTGVADAQTFTFATGDVVENSDDQGFGYDQDGNWTGLTAYVVGQILTNLVRDYVCVTSGTSAISGGPTGTGTGIVDGTCVWDYVADKATPVSIGGELADALEA